MALNGDFSLNGIKLRCNDVYMAEIDAYQGKVSGRRVLETALDGSQRPDQKSVAVEHILNASASSEDDLLSSTLHVAQRVNHYRQALLLFIPGRRAVRL
jgi:hypothetical protein